MQALVMLICLTASLSMVGANEASGQVDHIFNLLNDQPGHAIIIREEHGVLFERVSLLEVAGSRWGLVLAIEIPQVHDLEINQQFCDDKMQQADPELKTMCTYFKGVMQTYRTLEDKLITQLRHQHAEIQLLLPRRIDLQRKRRSLLPFVGDLAERLFGSVSQKTFNRLKNLVARIEIRGSKLAKSHQVLNEGLQSIQINTNKRLKLIRKSVDLSFNLTQTLQQRLTELAYQTRSAANRALAYINEVASPGCLHGTSY
jgi:hypothetical protein